MPGQILPGQMSPWQLESVLDVPRNLPVKFHQNRVSNSWDIPDMDECRKDKCCLHKCHHYSWNLFEMFVIFWFIWITSIWILKRKVIILSRYTSCRGLYLKDPIFGHFINSINYLLLWMVGWLGGYLGWRLDGKASLNSHLIYRFFLKLRIVT